jgi:hypothetical protein
MSVNKKAQIFSVALVLIVFFALISSLFIVAKERSNGSFDKEIGEKQKALLLSYSETDIELTTLDQLTRINTYRAIDDFFVTGLIKECGSISNFPLIHGGKTSSSFPICQSFSQSGIVGILRKNIRNRISSQITQPSHLAFSSLPLPEKNLQVLPQQKNLVITTTLEGILKQRNNDPPFIYTYKNPKSIQRIDFSFRRYLKIVDLLSGNTNDVIECLETSSLYTPCFNTHMFKKLENLEKDGYKATKNIVTDGKFIVSIIDSQTQMLSYVNDKQFEIINPTYKFAFDFTATELGFT